MAVDEAGEHRAAAGVDALVGGGRVGGGPDPGDPAALDDQRGVRDAAEQASGRAGVVGDQLADAGDARWSSSVHRSCRSRRSSSRPMLARGRPAGRRPGRRRSPGRRPRRRRRRPRCARRAPVPAVRGAVVSRVTRSARRADRDPCRRRRSRGAWPSVAAAEQLGGGPVPALLGGEPLVELDRPHLLEQVDHRVAVGARGSAGCPASCSGAAGPDAVAEVALGGRAEAGVGPRARRAAGRRRR